MIINRINERNNMLVADYSLVAIIQASKMKAVCACVIVKQKRQFYIVDLFMITNPPFS